MVKVVPFPGTDLTRISPLWAFTMLCTICSPSPVPPSDSLKKGWKIRDNFSSGIPHPLSVISMEKTSFLQSKTTDTIPLSRSTALRAFSIKFFYFCIQFPILRSFWQTYRQGSLTGILPVAWPRPLYNPALYHHG